MAKARLVAVIVLRSTGASHARAVALSRAIAARIAQQPGWDARVVAQGGKSPGDAAAGIGADAYLIGQFLDGPPPHVLGASFRAATDEKIGSFAFDLSDGLAIPKSISFSDLVGETTEPLSHPVARASVAPYVTLPAGDLISVILLKDIGSRISQEGDSFAVVTAEDYYFKGQLILPKGSPGYGTITHLKAAGSFHAGGELNFTVKRLITPTNTEVSVETSGATADADKTTEQNGNAFGQYLLWGVGMFAKRGNDILVKKGTLFHVSTTGSAQVPVALPNAQPAFLDAASEAEAGMQTGRSGASETSTVAVDVVPARAVSYTFDAPKGWASVAPTSQLFGTTALGSWKPEAAAAGIDLNLVSQQVADAASYAQSTLRSMKQALGAENVLVFRTESICGGTQQGWYAETVVPNETNSIVVEQVITVAGGNSYVVTYRRLQRQPEDVRVRASLDSICTS